MSLLNKNLLPNLVAIALILVGWAVPGVAGNLIFYTGLFALSGAVTNWLAIHMLFERVPGLYGSGVIPLHFEEFKSCLLYTSPSPRDLSTSRMPSSA